jgi:hypothetical protein
VTGVLDINRLLWKQRFHELRSVSPSTLLIPSGICQPEAAFPEFWITDCDFQAGCCA